MAGRNREPSLIGLLTTEPWWVSVGLGVIAFIAIRWIVPAIFLSNPILRFFIPIAQAAAWLPLFIFGLIGLIIFARSKAEALVDPKLTDPTLPNWARTKRSTNRPLSKLDVEWERTVGNHAEPKTIVKSFDQWTMEALRDLEWKRFELLCAKYYEAVGFKSETIRCGADGGIDIKLFRVDPNKPIAIVQCKAWNSASVGVKEVRELLGVMTHENVTRGVFITTSEYTHDALEFGNANPMQLLDGPGFLKKIQELPKESRDSLLKFAFEGDYRTPTCASCGIKMVKREGKRGAFWGCLNYPRCKSTFGSST